jgi:restriction system protein
MSAARKHVPLDMSVDFTLPMWRETLGEEDLFQCIYCGSYTDDYDDPRRWDLSFDKFSAVHETIVNDPEYPGPPTGDPHVILNGSILERKVCLHICPQCGWWVAEDRAVLPAKEWQLWVVTLASASALQELSLEDVELPLQEVRRYLMRRFESRTTMHPRLFELTVASVFDDLGYKATATAYSNDGGIDVVLEGNSGERIGVQVKRQKNSIEVEQIRAFLGALTLGGFSKGVFVSSSRFSRGATCAAQQSTERVLPIELVNADRFFDMLGCAQLKSAPRPKNCGISRRRPLKFQYHSHYHLNSL